MTASEIVQALAEPFMACELEMRTQPFVALYVDARTMVKRLNRVLPGDWSFHLIGDATSDAKGNLSRAGTLTLHYPQGPRDYTSVGTETPDQDRGEPKSEKGSDSDTFKRCCFRAGIGAYLYEFGKNEIKNPTLTAEQVTTAARLAGYEGPILPEHYGPLNRHRATGDPKDTKASAKGAGRVAVSPQEQEEIAAIVAAGGGSVISPAFSSWLEKHTANRAACLADVLQEDVPKLRQLLQYLAEKRAAS